MPLSSTALADALKAEVVNQADEADAVEAWGEALVVYFGDAVAGGIPIAGVAAAKPLITAALVGMSVPGAGAAKIQAAFVAFWAAVVASTSAYFPGTIPPTTAPPLLGTMEAAMAPVLLANTTGALPLDASLDALAAVIHPLNLGGITTLPGAPPVPVLIT